MRIVVFVYLYLVALAVSECSAQIFSFRDGPNSGQRSQKAFVDCALDSALFGYMPFQVEHLNPLQGTYNDDDGWSKADTFLMEQVLPGPEISKAHAKTIHSRSEKVVIDDTRLEVRGSTSPLFTAVPRASCDGDVNGKCVYITGPANKVAIMPITITLTSPNLGIDDTLEMDKTLTISNTSIAACFDKVEKEWTIFAITCDAGGINPTLEILGPYGPGTHIIPLETTVAMQHGVDVPYNIKHGPPGLYQLNGLYMEHQGALRTMVAGCKFQMKFKEWE